MDHDFVAGAGGFVDGVEGLHQGRAVFGGGFAGGAVQDAVHRMINLVLEQAAEGERRGVQRFTFAI